MTNTENISDMDNNATHAGDPNAGDPWGLTGQNQDAVLARYTAAVWLLGRANGLVASCQPCEAVNVWQAREAAHGHTMRGCHECAEMLAYAGIAHRAAYVELQATLGAPSTHADFYSPCQG